MKRFSKAWKSSKKPKKQRKYRYFAPLHIKQKFMRSHLSKELIKKYSKRSAGIRKGDTVKVIRGQYKGKTGKVERADLKKEKVYITGIETTKKEGSKAFIPIHPSNLVIQEINLDDKRRAKKFKTTTSKEGR